MTFQSKLTPYLPVILLSHRVFKYCYRYAFFATAGYHNYEKPLYFMLTSILKIQNCPKPALVMSLNKLQEFLAHFKLLLLW